MFASDPHPWKILQQRYTLDRRPYMVLREDTVALAGGTLIPDYFVFEYPDWVSVLALTEQGELLLIRQYRHGIGQVHYELVAGVADAGSSLLENAQRELLEETGYGGGVWEPWMTVSANPATHTNLAHTFLARGVRPLAQQRLEHTEEITVHLVPLHELKALLLSGGVAQAIHAAALWRFLAEQ